MKVMTIPLESNNTRRSGRLSLPLPILVESKKSVELAWSESTRLKTVTTFGAGFNLQHEVSVGQVIHLTTAFPTKLRCYDFWESQYRVWALVRHCNILPGKDIAKPIYNIGVAFLGKNPPVNYFQNPSSLYSINQFDKHGLCLVGEYQTQISVSVSQPSRPQQKHARYSIPFEVIIETLDGLSQEFSVTENISLGGAAVKSLMDVKVGNLVRIRCLGKSLSIVATVRNYRLGPDGIPRVHLEFMDRQFPLDGIE
jgi:hypothetical protein